MRGIVIVALIIALFASIFFLLFKGKLSSTGNTTQNNQVTQTAAPLKATREITVVATEYKFTPSEIKLKKGETVKITLKNEGAMNHNWMVEKMGGASIDTINKGETSSITVTPSQTGTFTTFCSIGNHKSLGMVGKLIVE